MGMSQKQPKQKVGNAFFASFAIAVASNIDKFKSIWIDEEKIQDIEDDAASRFIKIKTGKNADQYPSATGKSNVQLFNGKNNSINPRLSNITGIISKYKSLAYVYFDKAFLGDNVQSYPNYAFELERVHIMNWLYQNDLLDLVITDDNTKQANPSVVLYYILKHMAEIDENLIDKNSFINAAITLKNEKFGIALIINKENDLKNIIEEILRHIDATFYFNIKTGKYTIKLLRADYDVNNLIKINDEDIKEINYKKGTYNDISTHIVLNYISPINYKKSSVYAENASVKLIVKQNKTTEINMLCIQDQALAERILVREFKKYCTPLATIKFKIPNSFKLEVFDVFKFSSNKLKINDMVCRVLEKSADEYEKNYYEITCTEDIYSENDYEIIKTQDSLQIKKNYSINENSKVVSNIIVLNKDITQINDYPCLLINDNIDSDEYVDRDLITYNNKIFSQTTENYTTLAQDILYNSTNFYLDEIILNRKDFMFNEKLTDQEWQSNSRLLVVNNEIMSYKELIILNSTQVKLKNIIRNINNTIIQRHFNNDIVFFISNFDVFELTNYNNEEYAKLDIVVKNDINQSTSSTYYVSDFDDYNLPYLVDNLQYNSTTKTLTWNTTHVNKNYTANYLTLEELEKNVTSLVENSLDINQSFELHIKYFDNTEEIINTTNTTYTFTKNISINNCFIYNIINNKYSNPSYF